MQHACALLYWYLWPAPLYHIFPHYLTKGTVLGKQITELKMCVLTCSTTLVWSISHSKKNWARCDRNVQRSSPQAVCCAPFYCHILMKLEFFEQIFEKYSNIEFHENQSSGSRVFPCKRAERHDEAKICFSQFCEPTNKDCQQCHWQLVTSGRYSVFKNVPRPVCTVQHINGN